MPKVLIVATSRKTRGGITSVIKAHETGEQWKKFHCRWIQTHRDGNTICKLYYLCTALLQYMCLLPFYDIVHIHMAAVERKIPFIFIASLFKKKILVHLHIPDPKTTIFTYKKKIYGWCFKKADIVIVLSTQWKQMLIKTYQLENIRVVYNPCPIVNKADISSKNRILYAGHISERKGYKDLLYAFAEIAPQHPDWTLLFAGNGNIEEGVLLSNKLGISNQVSFLGWITGKNKETIFQETSVFCLPSYAEGFPMGVLDAWAYGIPVICTPVGGLPDIVEDGINSLVFYPGNKKELIKKLNEIISNHSLRLKLHQASLDIANNIFNINIINKKIELIYTELYAAQ